MIKSLSIILLLALSTLSFAQIKKEKDFLRGRLESTGAGNSGDTISQEFTGLAIDVLSLFKKIASSHLYEKEIQKLERALKEAKVYTVDFNLCWEEKPDCTAKESLVSKNFPDENIILVNRYRFTSIEQLRKKMLHSFHEFSGIARIEENSYSFSSKILEATSYERLSGDLEKRPQTIICTSKDGKWEAIYKARRESFFGNTNRSSKKSKFYVSVSSPRGKFKSSRMKEYFTERIRILLPYDLDIHIVHISGGKNKFGNSVKIQTNDYVLGKGFMNVRYSPKFFPDFRVKRQQYFKQNNIAVNCIFKDFL